MLILIDILPKGTPVAEGANKTRRPVAIGQKGVESFTGPSPSEPSPSDRSVSNPSCPLGKRSSDKETRNLGAGVALWYRTLRQHWSFHTHGYTAYQWLENEAFALPPSSAQSGYSECYGVY